jgi:hypothetical protein
MFALCWASVRLTHSSGGLLEQEWKDVLVMLA